MIIYFHPPEEKEKIVPEGKEKERKILIYFLGSCWLKIGRRSRYGGGENPNLPAQSKTVRLLRQLITSLKFNLVIVHPAITYLSRIF